MTRQEPSRRPRAIRKPPVVHLELHTRDREQASAFYAELPGWRTEQFDTGCGAHHALVLGDGLDGGIVECGTPRSLWPPYVEVDRIDQATDRALERRPARVLPIDYGPPSDPHDPLGPPLIETAWIEPYPDGQVGVTDERAAPEARYEQREAVELAFIAALQHLTPRQRAVLILRDVLGFSARETAEALDTTPVSIGSALQRAHDAVDGRLPERSQQVTLRQLGDEQLSAIVNRYVEAWAQSDVDTIVGMLMSGHDR
ncbi:MAG: hypothetical protein JOY58_06725 [Solirubrobacterales bacterium]|nr:hypothetical protein [Solirubrobacterales bacterium]